MSDNGRGVRKVYMYQQPDGTWLQRNQPLPPLPHCMFCPYDDVYLMAIGYGSKYDGEFICPEHLDEAIDLLKGGA